MLQWQSKRKSPIKRVKRETDVASTFRLIANFFEHHNMYENKEITVIHSVLSFIALVI